MIPLAARTWLRYQEGGLLHLSERGGRPACGVRLAARGVPATESEGACCGRCRIIADRRAYVASLLPNAFGASGGLGRGGRT